MKTSELSIGVSGFFGTVLCLLTDIGLKGEGSAIKVIRDNLAKFFSVNTEALLIIAVIIICLLIFIGVASCYIFSEASNAKAFYRGASIIAIAMTLVPSPQYPAASTERKSERVNVTISTSDKRPLPNIKLTVWDLKTNSITSVTTYSASNFFFYQNAGSFRLDFEAPGYRIARYDLVVQDNIPVPPLIITLYPTAIPGFIQRVFPTK